MKSFTRKNKKSFKKIFSIFLMFIVLVNAGFIPVFENGLSSLQSVKIAHALTDQEINQKTQSFLKTRTGRQPDGTYAGGIYSAVLSKTGNEQEARSAADRAEINLYSTARSLVESEANRRNSNEAAAEYRHQTTQFTQLMADEKYKNELIDAETRDAEYRAADITYSELEVGDALTPEERSAQLQEAMQNEQDRVNAVNGITGNSPQSSSTQGPAEPIECGIGSIKLAGKEFGGGNIEGCFAIIAYNILKISAAFLHLVGILFDLTLNFTLNIGRYIPRSTTGELGLGGPAGAIYVGWSTIRDFINVAFIFVLLYAAISIILQTDKYGLQKTIVKVVIAALLLNFSLFFTKAIIDLSNIVALQFYARMLNIAKDSGGQTSGFDGELSSGFRNAIGLQSLWTGTAGESSDVNQFAAGLTPYKLIALSIFGSVFILVFSFVLFMAVVLFVLRSIVLIFLLITSPIGFLFGAVPGLEGVSKDWWERLKKNAIFAPAYMAVMYISCLMIFGGANSSLKGGSSLRDLITSDTKTGSIGIAFWFAFVIGFLIAAQIGARKFADSFGSSYTGKIDKWAQGVPKWLGGKSLSLSGRAAKGTAALAGAGAGFAARKTLLNGLGRGLLTKTPLKNVGGQKAFDALAAKDLEVAKEKAKNLRRMSGEGKTAYAIRQNKIINRAKNMQAAGFGLNNSHFDTDAEGNMTLNQAGKTEITAMKARAQEKAFKFRRKRAAKTIERVSDAYTGPKKGSEEDVKTVIKKMEDDLKTKKDTVFEALAQQYKDNVDTLNTQANAIIAAGGTINAALATDLAVAKKKLATHTNPVNSLENKLAEAKEKLEKIKEQNKEKEKKDKEKKENKK